MIPAQKSRRRTHFDPESRFNDDTLTNQKNKLLNVLADYIAKRSTKDEALVALTEIQEICEVCDDTT
jgi:hypothetical protein